MTGSIPALGMKPEDASSAFTQEIRIGGSDALCFVTMRKNGRPSASRLRTTFASSRRPQSASNTVTAGVTNPPVVPFEGVRSSKFAVPDGDTTGASARCFPDDPLLGASAACRCCSHKIGELRNASIGELLSGPRLARVILTWGQILRVSIVGTHFFVPNSTCGVKHIGGKRL